MCVFLRKHKVRQRMTSNGIHKTTNVKTGKENITKTIQILRKHKMTHFNKIITNQFILRAPNGTMVSGFTRSIF